MDWPEKLNVRFHYNGEFLHDGKKMHYCGGTVAMSYIDHDKVSLPELIGHLKDHCTVLDGTMLHWLIPGRELHNGLRALVDNKACLDMLRCTEDGFFAEVYVEAPVAQEISDDEAGTGSEDKKSDYEDEMDTEFENEASMEDEEEALPRDANLGSGAKHIVPYNPQSGVIVHNQIKTGPAGNACPSHGGATNPGDEISSTDSEFLAGDDSSSEEDEEAKEILRRFKEFKKKLSSGQTAQLDDIFVGGTSTQTGSVIYCSEIYRLVLGKTGCSPLINRREYLMLYNTGLLWRSIGIVQGTCMPTGGKNSRRRNGRRDGGNVLKHHAHFYSIWQGLDWHSSLEKEHKHL